MEKITYTLRLLTTEFVNSVSERVPKDESGMQMDHLPKEISIDATHVEIAEGVVKFMDNEDMITAMALNSFVWSPLGQTPERVRMAPFPLARMGKLHSQTFSFSVVVDFLQKKVSVQETQGSDKKEVQFRNDNLEISCPANAIVLCHNLFYFLNENGEYLYSVPANRSYFKPFGAPMVNMKVWNVAQEGKMEIVQTFSQGESGSSGVDGSSGTSGSSGISGNDGMDGLNGANGSAGTSGIDGSNGNAGESGSSGISGSSGTSGITFDTVLGFVKYEIPRELLKNIRKAPVGVLSPKEGKALEIVTATLIVNPGKDLEGLSSHNLALCLDDEVVGGWKNPLIPGGISCHRATILDGYSYPPNATLCLKSDISLESIDYDVTLHVSYRNLFIPVR